MFDRVVDERAQFINDYQKSTLRGPIVKQFSCSLVFCVLPRHTNKLPDKGFNIFDECGARCKHLFLQEEECSSSSWGVWGGGCDIMYTSSSIANSQRMETEIKVAL